MADEHPWRDEERLREMYCGEMLTTYEIASEWGCCRGTIQTWLDKHEIPTRDRGKSPRPGEKDSVSCPDCDQDFDTEKGMKVHHGWKHDGDLDTEDESALNSWDHKCPDCEEEFSTERGLNIHHGRVHDGSLTTIEIECHYCGGREQRPKRQINNPDRVFCSRECHHKWKGDDTTKTSVECAECGGELERYKRRVEQYDRQFCGPSCRNSWYRSNIATGAEHPLYDRVEVECANCGAVEKRYPSQSGYENHFCSGDCYGEWASENLTGEDAHHYKGGEYGYGPGWTLSKKEAVRERDDRECQHCGRGEEEHLEEFGRRHAVHHITPARSFDDPQKRNAMNNLVTLCVERCHQDWEAMAPLRPDTRSNSAG
ncbi:HNH endonuclease [Halosimplex pelagicum]|uniref:HNH endonuclease n=1 Tax=Halosimplex pelagicum TaxID=869886 RepID=A0A7D5T8I9_9EURY|nr:HNH endonuclease [Halosimplex pelagicum]QLH80990.1 HNH endonuclease [Halosimplex pelagicum]